MHEIAASIVILAGSIIIAADMMAQRNHEAVAVGWLLLVAGATVFALKVLWPLWDGIRDSEKGNLDARRRDD